MVRHKLKVQQMYWDASFDSWTHYNVASQPAAILISADGKIVQSWTGSPNLKTVTA